MSTSDYAENKILETLLKATAFTPATHASLHTGSPGETGANEVAGGSYARQLVAAAGWTAAAGGLSDNLNAITFGGMPAGEVQAVGLWDAVAAGNFLAGGWLSTVKGVFTAADIATDLLASPVHGLAANDRVAVEAEDAGTLPTGLNDTTLYHVIATGLTADAFKVSATQGGAAVDITTVGSGKWRKVVPKTIPAGETALFNAGDLDVRQF